MQLLVLIRHGESKGNTRGILTGLLNVPLTTVGRQQAEEVGRNIASLGVDFNTAYSSQLQRSKQTLKILTAQLPKPISVIQHHHALNERDFGDYTGLNKISLQEKLSDSEYIRVIRGWDVRAPNGESLKDVQLRVLSYFQSVIMKDLIAGKNVIISSHHQTLRALVKYIERIEDDEISVLTIKNAEPIIYTFNSVAGLIIRQHYDFPVAT